MTHRDRSRIVGAGAEQGCVYLQRERLGLKLAQIASAARTKKADLVIPRAAAARAACSKISFGTEIAVFIYPEYNRV